MSKKIVPDWKLERYLLGELPADDMAFIRTYEQVDEELRGRIAALRASDAEILERFPPEQAAKRIVNLSADTRTQAQTARGSVWSRIACVFAPPQISWSSVGTRKVAWWTVPIVTCIAFTLLLPFYDSVVNFEPITLATATNSNGDRVKGTAASAVTAAAIEVWRKEGNTAKKLEANATAREGDVIQLRYTVPEQCFGAVVSMDGRGVLTIHLSGANGNAVPLTPGQSVALKNAYELDDAPYYEIFYLITSAESFGLDDVEKSLKAAKHPVKEVPLPAGAVKDVTAFMLKKSQDIGMN